MYTIYAARYAGAPVERFECPDSTAVVDRYLALQAQGYLVHGLTTQRGLTITRADLRSIFGVCAWLDDEAPRANVEHIGKRAARARSVIAKQRRLIEELQRRGADAAAATKRLRLFEEIGDAIDRYLQFALEFEKNGSNSEGGKSASPVTVDA